MISALLIFLNLLFAFFYGAMYCAFAEAQEAGDDNRHPRFILSCVMLLCVLLTAISLRFIR